MATHIWLTTRVWKKTQRSMQSFPSIDHIDHEKKKNRSLWKNFTRNSIDSKRENSAIQNRKHKHIQWSERIRIRIVAFAKCIYKYLLRSICIVLLCYRNCSFCQCNMPCRCTFTISIYNFDPRYTSQFGSSVCIVDR